MAEPTLERLESAFMQAHKAGDKKNAGIFAAEIRRRRAAASQPTAKQQLMYMPDEFTGEATPEAKEFLPGFGTSMLQGATFGLSDEIGAGVEGLKAMARGEEFMPAAKQRMAQTSAERAAFRKKYPVGSFVGEVLGSLPGGIYGGAKLAARQLAKGTGKLASVGQQALLSGTGGAVAGAGMTEGGLEQRGKGALFGGLTGTALGATGAALPTGRLMPSPKTREAISLLDEGVPLTVGQQLGGLVKGAEDVFSDTLLGKIGGIPEAKRKAFQGFSKGFINEALAPIGAKVPEGMTVKKAGKWAEDKIKDEFGKAVRKANLSDAEPVINMLEKAIKPKSLNDIDLNLDDIKLVKDTLQKSVASNIFDGKMTGQMVQKSLKALNNAQKKTDIGDNVKQVIKAAKEELEGILVAQNRDNKALLNARKAYTNMFPMKKAVAKGKGRGAFSPEQAEDILSASPVPRTSGMYKRVEEALGPLAGDVPTRRAGLGINLPNIGTTGALASQGLSVLPFIAGMPLVYRTGPLGAAVAREVISTPGYLAKSLAATPSLSGMAGGLLAGEQE